MRTVGIIGLGLIGGSMAIDLKRRGFAQKVLGVERDSIAAEAAKTIGLVDEVVNYDACIQGADILVVAVPVSAAVKMVPDILDRMSPEQIVIDVCSTKSQVCHATQYHPRRGQFVSTHPMAGTEYSGPWAAQPGLFDGRACIFANSEESNPTALQTIEQLYGVLNMRPIYMNADQHDTSPISPMSLPSPWPLPSWTRRRTKNTSLTSLPAVFPPRCVSPSPVPTCGFPSLPRTTTTSSR